MSKIHVQPHLRVLGSDIDPDDEDFEGWSNYLDYHIAAPEAGANNMYIGTVIRTFIDYVSSNPEMFWKIEYYEERTIDTTGGMMRLPGRELPATIVCHDGVHEEFRDRNSDGHLELNRALPVFPEYPRYYTEHEVAQAELHGEAESADCAEAKSGVTPGEEVEGEDEPDDTVHVSDGDLLEVYDELGHKQTLRISVV